MLTSSENSQISVRSFLSAFAVVALFLISLLASPNPATAQSTSDLVNSAELTTDADFEDDNISGRIWIANIETCRNLLGDDEELTFRWELTQAYSDQDLRYAIKLQRPGGSCDTNSAGQENAETCEFIESNQRVGSSTIFEVDVFPSRIFDFSGPDDCFTEIDGAYDMILVLPLLNVIDDGDEFEPDVIRIRLDTDRPEPPPGAIRVSGGEVSLEVKWDDATEGDRYKIYASTTPFAAGDLPEVITGASTATVTGTSGSIRSGITANQTYYVGVVSIDDSGNESVISAVTEVTTQPTTDFWEAYRGAGGAETGGNCSQSRAPLSGGLAAMLMLGFCVFRRRREDI